MSKLSRPLLMARTFALLAAAAVCLGPAAVFAQDVAVGSATATVQAVLQVQATAALAFGTVFQGIPKSIANSAADAGVFTITGEGGAGISVYMQLPDYLATATGDDRMVISFGTTDASVDSTVNVNPAAFGSGWQDVDPHNFPNTITVGTAGQNQSAIFLGGKVIPSVDQAAGAYSGDVVLTVAYNGS
ncbi:MAG TPA: hypothetical protein VMY05_02950 [Acidobacteriota bacterium]|nr:hypothetical protein [Acidobacteriota bacterium]